MNVVFLPKEQKLAVNPETPYLAKLKMKCKMGLVYQTLAVKENRKSQKSITLEFLIDSGAVYSLVPAKILSDLGIEPYKKMTFVLADGTKIERDIGDAYFELNGNGGSAPVIFGNEGDEPLLGATTLESLALVLNPFNRELYPMRLLNI
jgi:clan AA aspartic protease